MKCLGEILSLDQCHEMPHHRQSNRLSGTERAARSRRSEMESSAGDRDVPDGNSGQRPLIEKSWEPALAACVS